MAAPGPSKRRRFYTSADVAVHNSKSDCWVSVFHRVLDLTSLLAQDHGKLAEPIVLAAGSDVSYWFDSKTQDVKTAVHPVTNLVMPYTPQGRFIHVAPAEPVSTWATDFGEPWWRDPKYQIGQLSRKTRKINVVNTLSGQTDMLEVASEETLTEIQDRYFEYNSHAGSYTWKALFEGAFRPLDMAKTLAENGVEDESEQFERLSIDPDLYTPTLHLYFNDDLTSA